MDVHIRPAQPNEEDAAAFDHYMNLAWSLYERRGMRIEAQSKPILGAAGSTAYRMVKDL